jgi:hypothetical protein
MDYVKLRNQQGSFHDQETGLRLSRDDEVPLKPPIGKKTQERLDGGGLIRIPAPAKAQQQPCQPEPDATHTTPEEGTPVMPGLADPAGNGIGETTEGEVAAADAAPKPSPAKTKRKRKKKE